MRSAVFRVEDVNRRPDGLTAARYSHPSRVGMYVTSATHDVFGSAGSNSRSRTFSATGSPRFESVVCRCCDLSVNLGSSVSRLAQLPPRSLDGWSIS